MKRLFIYLRDEYNCPSLLGFDTQRGLVFHITNTHSGAFIMCNVSLLFIALEKIPFWTLCEIVFAYLQLSQWRRPYFHLLLFFLYVFYNIRKHLLLPSPGPQIMSHTCSMGLHHHHVLWTCCLVKIPKVGGENSALCRNKLRTEEGLLEHIKTHISSVRVDVKKDK